MYLFIVLVIPAAIVTILVFLTEFQTMGMGIILVPLISYVETMAVAKNFGNLN